MPLKHRLNRQYFPIGRIPAIRLRMDARLRGRVDADDILQETWIDASSRLSEYVANRSMSFYLWLRFLAGQKLTDAMRHHLGAQKRDAGREVSIHRRALPQATSMSSPRRSRGFCSI